MTDTIDATPAKARKAAEEPRVSARLIESVEVQIEAFLGSARMTVAELTALAPDAVVELDAQLNAPVELRLNGVAIGHGELVAVGEKFAVRLTGIAKWPD